MMFSRIVGGSCDGRETHKSKYYEIGYHEMIKAQRFIETQIKRPLIADPFARNCTWGTHTNDIDPDTLAKSHMDALLWLESLETEHFDYVLFDPPFSSGQAERKYESGHVNIYADPSYLSKCFAEVARILKPGGKVLKLGYNSSRHSPLLDLEKGWIVNFGASRNDVIMTLWIKGQARLTYWQQEWRGME
tara:strand:- start:561 stop:1130 length:570 start_codon:yes stop_codon:yes gene_type:complete